MYSRPVLIEESFSLVVTKEELEKDKAVIEKKLREAEQQHKVGSSDNLSSPLPSLNLKICP